MRLLHRVMSGAQVVCIAIIDQFGTRIVMMFMRCGDILVADRAYTDFKFLCSLAMRGVFYVVRWKRNIKLEVVSARPVEKPEAGKRSEARVRVLKDEIVKPAMPGTAKSYSCDGGVLRCVTAEVEYDGKMLEMSFLENAV